MTTAPDFSPDVLPLLQLSFDDAANAVFAGGKSENIVGLASVRPGRAKAKPYLHWYAPVHVRQLHQLQAIADSIDGYRYWFPQIFVPASCDVVAAGKRLEWRGVPSRFAPRTSTLSELCSIVVDLDVGREGKTTRRGGDLTADQAIDRTRELVGAGSLPCPSMIAKSGRGVYLIYLLTASASRKREPVRNDEKSQARWRHLASQLARAAHDLACDTASTVTPARAFKAPGRGGEPATYFAVASDPDVLRYWTFDDLEASLPPCDDDDGTELTAMAAPKGRREPSGKYDPARPLRRRIRELEELAAHRGGIAEGHRHNFLLCYTTDLRRLYRSQGVPWSEALGRAIDTARGLNRTFRPPLDDYDVRNLCRANSSMQRRQRNQTVAAMLDVTEAEALALRLRCLLPARLAAQQVRKKSAARAERQARHDAVDKLIRAGVSTAEVLAATGYSKSSICARRRALGVVMIVT